MKVKYKEKEFVLPDFFIVGAAKGGTTSLYYYLMQHPRIFLPEVKEPKFFSFRDNNPNFTSPQQIVVVDDFYQYAALFSNAKDSQVVGEASTSYLYTYKETFENISEIYGSKYKDLKIIIILRNPAERAWSYYSMLRRDGFEPLSFKEAISEKTIAERMKNRWNIYYDYLGFGKYSSQVDFYLKNFKYVKIFLQEDLKSNALLVLKEIFDFLGVEDYPGIDTSIRYNVSGEVKFKKLYRFLFVEKNFLTNLMVKIIPFNLRKRIRYGLSSRFVKKTEIDRESYNFLVDYYLEDVERLEKLINRDLSNWKLKK